MANISSNYFNFSSSLFSSASGKLTNSTNSGSSDNMLGDYASIKNGSYKKLLTAYYQKQKNETTNDNETTSSTVNKDLQATMQAAEGLKSATKTLTATGVDSIFEKVTKSVTDAKTGETKDVVDYDRDKIVSAVKSFVTAYNSTIDEAADQENVPLLRKATLMVSNTKANSNLLKKAGLTIGENNHLSLDETKLRNADISDLTTLFQGKTSYADRIQGKANDISLITVDMMSPDRLYGVNGKYSSFKSSGNLFNQTR
jgi:hypothetical protein